MIQIICFGYCDTNLYAFSDRTPPIWDDNGTKIAEYFINNANVDTGCHYEMRYINMEEDQPEPVCACANALSDSTMLPADAYREVFDYAWEEAKHLD